MNPWKIAVMIGYDYYVKAVSLTRKEAEEIVVELITCGINARCSPHVRS